MSFAPEHDPRRIPDDDLRRLRHCQHHDPHGFYGWHAVAEGSVVRTRQLGAEHVALLIDGRDPIDMEPIGDDIWAVHLPDTEAKDYRLSITWPGQRPTVTADPYYFLPTLGETDIYLISEGRHERLWEVLGSTPRSYTTSMGEVQGTSFAVWAPNAIGVAVVGNFCGWNASQYPMRSLGSSGI